MKTAVSQDYLKCTHCSAEFIPTYKQAQHLKYGECKNSFCSKACRITYTANSLRKIRPTIICPVCNKGFASKTTRKYCSLKCYNNSPEFRKMQLDNSKIANAKRVAQMQKDGREERNCLECAAPFNVIKSSRKRFCNKRCWRHYYAQRFDRWIANPQGMALPQGYDEFLDQEELPCLVEGCDWKGHWLSLHMNTTHGIPAEDFKRAAGFNLSTGVISTRLAEILQETRADDLGHFGGKRGHGLGRNSHIKNYHSLEGKEHKKKARMLMNSIPALFPERICVGCGVKFKQSSAFGRAKYHSIECRDKSYKQQRSKG